MESQKDLGRELAWGLLAQQKRFLSSDVLAAALEDWRREKLAFDHADIIADAVTVRARG